MTYPPPDQDQRALWFLRRGARRREGPACGAGGGNTLPRTGDVALDPYPESREPCLAEKEGGGNGAGGGGMGAGGGGMSAGGGGKGLSGFNGHFS